LSELKIEVTGVRPDEGTPKPFKEISMHFRLKGHLDRNKAERAVQLSVEKYCSVGASLNPDITIHYKTTLNP
jgi:putative redox protein